MNQDEAERCLDIGQAAERNGEYEKAHKFYTKSLKLCPTDKARARLFYLERLWAQQNEETKKEKESSKNTSQNRNATYSNEDSHHETKSSTNPPMDSPGSSTYIHS